MQIKYLTNDVLLSLQKKGRDMRKAIGKSHNNKDVGSRISEEIRKQQ